MKKLSTTELKYMEEIWKNPEGIKSSEIYRHFNQAPGTKSTILHRIIDKGFVSMQKEGRQYLYTPQISREEYYNEVFSGITEKVQKTIASFLGKSNLTNDEIEKLKDFLSEMKKEND